MMKMRIYTLAPDAVEIEAVVFNTPAAVDRFIRALEAAKETVWPATKEKPAK